MNQGSNTDKEINLIDMFWSVLEHLPLIIGAVVIGLAIGFVVARSKQQDAMREADRLAAIKEQTVEADSEDTASSMIYIEGVSECLSLEDQQMIESYLDYQKVYDDQVIFNSTDKMMQYDPNHVYTKRLMYVITALSDDCDVRMVSRAYTYLISGNGDVNKVAFYGEQYIGSSLSIDGEEGTLYPTDQEIAVVTVTIKGQDQADLDNLTAIIEDSFDSQRATINEKYGPFEIELDETDTSVVEDADVLAYQQKFVANLYSYRSSMLSLEGKFSEEAKEYMEKYREQVALGLLAEDENAGSNTPDTALSKKTIIVCMMAVVFVVVIFLACSYAFNPYIRLNERLGRFVEVSTLARIADIDKFGAIKKARYSGSVKLSTKPALEMLAAKLRVYASAHEVKDIYVSASFVSENQKGLLDGVNAAIKDTGANLILGESALMDSKGYEAACKSGYAVIACVSGKTRVADAINEIELLRDNHVEVIGVVIL